MVTSLGVAKWIGCWTQDQTVWGLIPSAGPIMCRSIEQILYSTLFLTTQL